MKSAGPGGPETKACRLYGDDVYDVIKVLVGASTNASALLKVKQKPDLAAVSSTFFEMCLTRAVDICITYISNILRLVFERFPEALKTEDKVKVSFVLQFSSMDDLVTELVEQKVQDLSYRSLEDLDEHLVKTLKISLFANSEQRQRAIWLVSIRNLIVHNRGIVNERFKKRNPQSSEKVGDKMQITANSLDELKFLLDWIMDFDCRFIEKFRLPTQPRVPRPKIPDLN